MIGHVYQVRTAPDFIGIEPHQKQHFAVQGSLVVIQDRYPSGNYMGLAPSAHDGQQSAYNFRPCDLKRIEFHEEVNE